MRRIRVALYREEKAPVIIPGVPQAGAERGGAPEALVRLVVASKQGEHVCARDVRLGQIGVEPQGLLARSQRLGAKEIGRASCRERVWISGGAGQVKEKE